MRSTGWWNRRVRATNHSEESLNGQRHFHRYEHLRPAQIPEAIDCGQRRNMRILGCVGSWTTSAGVVRGSLASTHASCRRRLTSTDALNLWVYLARVSGQLAAEGRLPHVVCANGDRIFRRAQIEVIPNARIAQQLAR